MKYSFHPEAEAEFVQAIEYYEECEAGLGYDFAVEVYSAIERTMAYQGLGQKLKKTSEGLW